MTDRTARAVIDALGLVPHPEGGWYCETWRAPAVAGARPSATAIHFLLAAGERSHWHRVDAAEIWLWHAGAPLLLSIAGTDDGPATERRMGPEVPDMAPQVVVPAHAWQAARSTGAWSLVSCVVSPGFTFEGFHLAPPEFDIPTR